MEAEEVKKTTEKNDEDEYIKKITAPIPLRGGMCMGWVPEIHELGDEHSFPASTFELELLARHWTEEIKSFQDEWEYCGQVGSSGRRLNNYGWHRLNKIIATLGQQRVAKIIEEVQWERFETSYFDAEHALGPDYKGELISDAQLFYTSRGRCKVFHHSRIGSRIFLTDEEVSASGWCWQSAEKFKHSAPIEHFGFSTATAALESAQAWEDSYFKQVEQQLDEAHCDFSPNEIDSRIPQSSSELKGLLTSYSVRGRFRVWSDDPEYRDKVGWKKDWGPRDRIEVWLEDSNSVKPSGRMIIDREDSRHLGSFSDTLSVLATPRARQQYEPIVCRILQLAKTDEDGYVLGQLDLVEILTQAGLSNVTKGNKEFWGMF
jgi:hypothetical protein